MIDLDSTAHRLKKRDMYELICRLYQGEELTHKEKSCLLLTACPAKSPKIAKNDYQFVQQAVAVKGVRPICSAIHVLDGMGYATDGHRAHARPLSLEDGSYCPLTGAPIGSSKHQEHAERIAHLLAGSHGDAKFVDDVPFRLGVYRSESVIKIGSHWYKNEYVDPVRKYFGHDQLFYKQTPAGELLMQPYNSERPCAMVMGLRITDDNVKHG